MGDDTLIRSCAYCEKEFGVKIPGDKVSHGVCKRHFERELKIAGIPPEKIQKFVNDPNKNFCEDLLQNPDLVKQLRGEF